eukprot:gnl/MRDRNA2_/MRDRNA2_141837_c0_seq1.p1 gnl/MRDRNA2_/MRDRNA2_141837_c0~~gnl/MRDRNA2_/MRDRNA2_141837_c0_seq1.p1  ORF type:complete len:219 (+),score=31.33 gnl/MRDRNA2_/MRDRNA2_141837_c0_seq1:70-726(+)
MGVFARFRAAVGVSQSYAANDDWESKGGMQQPLTEIPRSNTYLLPGSAVVQVSDMSRVTVASLEPGAKILGMDLGDGNEFIWATLQHVETLPATTTLQHEIIVGLGGDDIAFLKREQVVLTRDKKKKTGMQPVRQLRVGVDSVVVFDAHGVRWTSNIAEEVRKIDSLQARLAPPTDGLYQLTVANTNQALLVSYTHDSQFLAVNCSDPKLKSVEAPNM